MNIDLLPLTAFALEASGAAALAVGSAHTLTLMPPTHAASLQTLPLKGTARAGTASFADGTGALALPPQPNLALTLTF